MFVQRQKKSSAIHGIRIFCLIRDIRDFSLKFIRNLLKLNAAIAHFGIIDSPMCTFCSLNRVMVIEKETLMHFFQSCEITQSIALLFFNSFLMGHGIDFNIKWLFRGATTFLKKYEIKIINNEILVFYFFCTYRHYRKLPLIINIEYFFEWNRALWLKNSSYNYAWVKWKRDEGGGIEEVKELEKLEKAYSGQTLTRFEAASHLANIPWSRQQPGSCLLEGRYGSERINLKFALFRLIKAQFN